MKIERLGIIGGPSYHYNSDLLKEVYAASRNRAAATEETQFIFWEVGLDRFFTQEVDKYWANIGGWIASSSYTLSQDNGCDYIAIAGNFLPKINLEEELRLQQELSGGNPGFTRPVFIDMNDCVAEKLEEVSAKKILMLGPKYIMGDRDIAEFYKRTYGIEIMSLADYEDEVAEVDRIINEELAEDIFLAESKEFLVNFINQFPCDDSDERPDAIVLGCYELGLILSQDDICDEVPLIDGAKAHIEKIVSLASS